jgi:hypothetical protein
MQIIPITKYFLLSTNLFNSFQKLITKNPVEYKTPINKKIH